MFLEKFQMRTLKPLDQDVQMHTEEHTERDTHTGTPKTATHT